MNNKPSETYNLETCRIQIVYKDEIASAPGSVTQVRENAATFMQLAKTRNISFQFTQKNNSYPTARVMMKQTTTKLFRNYKIISKRKEMRINQELKIYKVLFRI